MLTNYKYMQIIYILEIDSHFKNKLLFENIFSNHY